MPKFRKRPIEANGREALIERVRVALESAFPREEIDMNDVKMLMIDAIVLNRVWKAIRGDKVKTPHLRGDL